MQDDEIRSMLRALRDEPVPEESLRRVQAKVNRRIHSRRWLWAAGALAAAASILVVFLSASRERTIAPAPAPVAHKGAPQVPAVTAPPPSTPHVAIGRVNRRRVAKPRRVEVPVVTEAIRIETPDPDVVILMLTGE